jgi:hypothetical protein
MNIYRKRGSVVRYERGVIIRVEEAGEAREIGEEFIAAPLGAPVILSREDGEGSQLTRVADEILRSVQDNGGVRVERLLVSEGAAEHEYGDRTWSETTRRLHLSLTDGTRRALLDQGDFALAHVTRVARALRACEGERALEGVVLEPNVAAALLPHLIGRIELEQTAALHDGYGRPIERCRVDGEPPNVYRPSYRMRPVPAWHHLRAIPFGVIDKRLPRAVALLAPPDPPTLQLLCVDGERSFVARVEVRSVRAAGEAAHWYPYAAGAFGAELML